MINDRISLMTAWITLAATTTTTTTVARCGRTIKASYSVRWLSSPKPPQNTGSYILRAKPIASAAVAKLTDSNEPDYGMNESQFKRVIMRNLQMLQTAAPENQCKTVVDERVETIRVKDQNELSVVRLGPLVTPVKEQVRLIQ